MRKFNGRTVEVTHGSIQRADLEAVLQHIGQHADESRDILSQAKDMFFANATEKYDYEVTFQALCRLVDLLQESR